MPYPLVIVHGGAWDIPHKHTLASLLGVEEAAKCAHAQLLATGSVLNAVETAVTSLEDNPIFDAGNGSCLNQAGKVEMDAVIMADGEEGLKAGGVAAVSTVRNPIQLARAVMEHTSHCLLVGKGADAFAREMDIPFVEAERELVTDNAIAEFDQYKKYGDTVRSLFNCHSPLGHDTVGAIAIDAKGNVAAATSTGGITFKRVGRVGDSPIIGSGLFAEANVGACSTTGHGESIMKTTLARHALFLMEKCGRNVVEAAGEALQHMKRKTGGCGGIILLDKHGNYAIDFTTKRMVWGLVSSDGTCTSGIDRSHCG